MNGPSFDAVVAKRLGNDWALIGELEELAGNEGLMTFHSQRAWSSSTFEGVRHNFTWLFEGSIAVEHGEAMISRLPDHDYDVPRQIVAEAKVTEVDHRIHPDPRLEVKFEVLVLKDD